MWQDHKVDHCVMREGTDSTERMQFGREDISGIGGRTMKMRARNERNSKGKSRSSDATFFRMAGEEKMAMNIPGLGGENARRT